MTLTQEQFRSVIKLIMPYFNVPPEERRGILIQALYPSPVLDQLTWTGNPRTFSTNLIRNLNLFDDTNSIKFVLEILRDSVGDPSKENFVTILNEFNSSDPRHSSDQLNISIDNDAMHYVFISYSRRDLNFVEQLRSDLQAHGVSYWIDKEGLTAGTRNWERSIREALRYSNSVIWVVSPASYDSEYVNSEIAVAEMYERKIYPVWAKGDNWIACVPLGKHNIQFVDMRRETYHQGLRALVAALKGGKPGTILPVKQPINPELVSGVQPDNPYKGLRAFQEDDAAQFFGREALTVHLMKRLTEQLTNDEARFLAVLGPSGAGKSSVVMAGLIPALKQGKLPGSDTWTYLPPLVPSMHPIEYLADALKTKMPDTSLALIEEDLNTPGGRMLLRLVRPINGERVLLYIDQFEELFTLTADEGERRQFINLLTEAVNEPNGKLIVLLSMRADFIDSALHYPSLSKLFNNYSELVSPMNIAELHDAIEKPARLPNVGLLFDPGLVAEIIFALRQQNQAIAGALPLLQFTLERLFEERDGNRLTFDAYHHIGGVAGAVGTHSERIFKSLPKHVQAKLSMVFLPLVHVDPDIGGTTRRRAPLSVVTADADAKTLVNTLIENRLLQTGRDSNGPYLEIAHEALLGSWDRLANWIFEVKADLYTLREVRKAAAIWDEHDRSSDYLWLGERGEEMRNMITRLNPNLNEVEKAFARPESEHLMDEIRQMEPNHLRRAAISERLNYIGDTRPGVGAIDGLPEIEWCHVPAGKLHHDELNFQVSSYWISKYPVTYIQFKQFWNAKEGFQNTAWWKNLRQFTYIGQDNDLDSLPCVKVNWYHCVAFTRWLNSKLPPVMYPIEPDERYKFRLPTDYEWIYAASSGHHNNVFGWGDTWNPQYANTKESGLGRAIAVGLYPHDQSDFGMMDICGNVHEWCLNEAGKQNVQMISSGPRTVKGGCYASDSHAARIFEAADVLPPKFKSPTIGFRLVYALKL
jgi:hypothetical protein